MITQAKPVILVTRRLPAEVEARLLRDYTPMLNSDDHLGGTDEILEKAQNTDGLLVTITDRIDRALIARLPARVRIIATFSVGYDHIDVVAAGERGIAVTNTPGVLTEATAELAILLLLGAARGAGNGEAAIRNARWDSWAPTGMLGTQMSGKRLGIFGMGEIGRAVAQRARAFNMTIHYHNRSRLPASQEHGATYHSSLEDMLPQCDFLSINCSSNPQTRGVIDATRLALLPRGAIVVNTARGDIVNEQALMRALDSGALGGVGLDVYVNEPNIDPAWRTTKNSFLLPHLGSATVETRNAMGHKALDNLDAFFAGRTPPNPARP